MRTKINNRFLQNLELKSKCEGIQSYLKNICLKARKPMDSSDFIGYENTNNYLLLIPKIVDEEKEVRS